MWVAWLAPCSTTTPSLPLALSDDMQADLVLLALDSKEMCDLCDRYRCASIMC